MIQMLASESNSICRNMFFYLCILYFVFGIPVYLYCGIIFLYLLFCMIENAFILVVIFSWLVESFYRAFNSSLWREGCFFLLVLNKKGLIQFDKNSFATAKGSCEVMSTVQSDNYYCNVFVCMYLNFKWY